MCIDIEYWISWFFLIGCIYICMYVFKNTPERNWWWTLRMGTHDSGFRIHIRKWILYIQVQYVHITVLWGTGRKRNPYTWCGLIERMNELLRYYVYYLNITVFMSDKSQQLYSCCCVKCHALKVTTTALPWLIIHKIFHSWCSWENISSRELL